MARRRRQNAEQLARSHAVFRAPLEARFVAAYRKQLELLRRASQQETEPFKADQWAVRISESMRPQYQAIMRASGRRYLTQLAPFVPRKAGTWVRKQGPAGAGTIVVDLAKSFAAGLAESILTTWDELSQVVVDAEAGGFLPSQIDDLLGDVWETIQGPRAEMVGLTATTGAINSVSAYLSSELVELNDWISAGDPRVRATHQTYAAAGSRPAGFNWADLSGGAYTLRFPADPECTELGEIINCRCFIVPAAASEPSGLRFDEIASVFT